MEIVLKLDLFPLLKSKLINLNNKPAFKKLKKNKNASYVVKMKETLYICLVGIMLLAWDAVKIYWNAQYAKLKLMSTSKFTKLDLLIIL